MGEKKSPIGLDGRANWRVLTNRLSTNGFGGKPSHHPNLVQGARHYEYCQPGKITDAAIMEEITNTASLGKLIVNATGSEEIT